MVHNSLQFEQQLQHEKQVNRFLMKQQLSHSVALLPLLDIK